MFNLFKKTEKPKKQTIEDKIVLKTMEFINSLTLQVPFKYLVLEFSIEKELNGQKYKKDISYFIKDGEFYLNPHNLTDIESEDPKAAFFLFNGKWKNQTELGNYEYLWFTQNLIRNEFDRILAQKKALYKI